MMAREKGPVLPFLDHQRVKAASARLAGQRGRHAPPKSADALADTYRRGRAELTPAQARRVRKRRHREGSTP